MIDYKHNNTSNNTTDNYIIGKTINNVVYK